MGTPRLLEMIQQDHLHCGLEAEDWRGVVAATGKLMDSRGLTDPCYTAAMIQLIEDSGPYLVIAPGVALLHARPEDGVKQAGMVVLALSKPIPFGHSSNDPVRLVFGLAAKNDKSHIHAMAELATLLSAEGAIEALANCSSSSDLWETIRRFADMEG